MGPLAVLTLMLLRHAKAVQQSRGDDFARDLQEKGKADAKRLGRYLDEKAIFPDLALVSSSARTRQTFQILEAALGRRIVVGYEGGLYNATAGELRGMLRSVSPTVRNLMVVGHNPGIADAALMLSRDGDLSELMRMRNRFPPGGLAVICFDDEEWRDAAARGGRLELFLLPENLAS